MQQTAAPRPSVTALLRAAPENLVLASVPEDVRRRLLAGAELWDLQRGSMLTRQGDPVSEVIFPLSGALSTASLTPEGRVAAPSIRGRESAVNGTTVLVSADPRYANGVVVIPLRAIAVPLADYRATLDTSVELLRAILAASATLVQDFDEAVVCSRHHPPPRRIAFCLLLLDAHCGGGGAIPTTHERIAALTGTSRPSASVELGHLQQAGLVDLRRGSIAIREREALADRACACRDRVTRLEATFAAGRVQLVPSAVKRGSLPRRP